jgi:hypothetical protein
MSNHSPMDRPYVERNRQQRERLEALVGRLSDEELHRQIGDGAWTVAATLAHLAYWDIRAVGALEAAIRHGLPLTFWDESDALPVNQVLTPRWLAVPPREAAQRAVAAAIALDHRIETLPEELIPAIARERYRVLERALHRAEQLDEIERSLTTETPR